MKLVSMSGGDEQCVGTLTHIEMTEKTRVMQPSTDGSGIRDIPKGSRANPLRKSHFQAGRPPAPFNPERIAPAANGE